MQDFYDEHAISTKVGNARPYIHYEIGDPDGKVREAWADNPRFAAFIANQSSGTIIPRYAPRFLGLPNVTAELRPTNPVVTSSHHHYHGDEPRNDLVFPSTGNRLPRQWIHYPWEMKTHINEEVEKGGHGGVNTQEVHLRQNIAKYTFSGGPGAKRLDIHPQAFSKLFRAQRVMLGKEGCIKADAMLSAGEVVFSWASVTLWPPEELRKLARWLRDLKVYLIPDADWKDKIEVSTQAWLCRSYLRRYGVDAHVAAPPYEAFVQNKELKGIDDHLANGGTMDDLEVLKRETPYGLAEFLAERGMQRKNTVVRAAEALEGLALHANENGQINAGLQTVARATGQGARRMQRAVHDLADIGAVEIDGSLETAPRWRDKEKGWVGYDWRDRPTITVHPQLRAKTSVHRLGDE
jgi:hypothetical protein